MEKTEYTPPLPSENGFSDIYLRNLKATGQRYEISDPGAKGLRIRVNKGGSKCFVWYYRDGNKSRPHIFGDYGIGDGFISLSDARKKLIDAKARWKQKIKPGAQTIDAPTNVGELCEVFYKRRILPHRKRPDAARQILDADIIPKLGKKKLSNNSLTPTMLAHLVDSVVDRGATVHAGKVLATLKQMFSFAEGRGYIQYSPAHSLKRKDCGVVEKPRTRALDVDAEGFAKPELEEIQALWKALEKAPRLSLQIKNALKILLLTGVRVGELRLAQWEHIDFKKHTWFIPAENTKTGKAWTVPLVPLVEELFKKLHEAADESEWVLASDESEEGHITDKAIRRALKRLFDLKDKEKNPVLDIPYFVPHDFRRTLRSHLGRLRVAPHIAEKCLNHSLGRIDATYDRHTYLDERREALQFWADVVDLAVNKRDNVVQMAANR